MYTKAQIFNLALDALLLQRRVVDVDTDTSSEVKTLKANYDIALNTTLEELDLNATFVTETLELTKEDPNKFWKYAYKYPANCAFFRRIPSCVVKDNRATRIKHSTGTYNNKLVIFTNEALADGEYIPKDLNLSILNGNAIMVLAHNLAYMSSSLIVGKGAQKIRQEIMTLSQFFTAKAKNQDTLENDTFQDPIVNSEWVQARID